MKTPRVKRARLPIVVKPPSVSAVAARRSLLTAAEARAIVLAILPEFSRYARQYDEKKYWPEVYERVRKQFRMTAQVKGDVIRDALLWKFGHLGKPAIPSAHERLIAHVQRDWPKAVASLPRSPEEAFSSLDRDCGGKTRFITTAFLLHLLYPRSVPIIDQHNFRAVNQLVAGARPGWTAKKKPARYADIVVVATFMRAVLKAWGKVAPRSRPNARELDKFLMMYGKAIK